MLDKLAAYRPTVARSLRGWGAAGLLQRHLAATRDADAADVCVGLLQQLGMSPEQLAPLRQLHPQRLKQQHTVIASTATTNSSGSSCGSMLCTAATSPAGSIPLPLSGGAVAAGGSVALAAALAGGGGGQEEDEEDGPVVLCRAISAAAAITGSGSAQSTQVAAKGREQASGVAGKQMQACGEEEGVEDGSGSGGTRSIAGAGTRSLRTAGSMQLHLAHVPAVVQQQQQQVQLRPGMCAPGPIAAAAAASTAAY